MQAITAHCRARFALEAVLRLLAPHRRFPPQGTFARAQGRRSDRQGAQPQPAHNHNEE